MLLLLLLLLLEPLPGVHELRTQDDISLYLLLLVELQILKYKYIYRVSPKKRVFCEKRAITTSKLIQNPKVGGVLENSGWLLHYGH